MAASSKSEQDVKEEVVDNISQVEVSSEAMDTSKLAALKAKQQAKQTQEQKMAAKIVAKKERSLELGIVGTGHGGSRIAACFYQMGYNAVICNTAMQDLKLINVPDSNKLLLENGVGGSSKEISLGEQAFIAHKDAFMQLVNDKLSDSQVFVLCSSLGGGSGAGSLESAATLLASLGKPVIVIGILPMDSEDAHSKSNSLTVLNSLTGLVKNNVVSNLIIVDNAKLESIYSNVNQMDFFDIANKAIVSPIDALNRLSSMPSQSKSLDSMEWSKLILDSNGFSTYGELTIKDFSSDTSIAEAVVESLNNSLLSSFFNLRQAKYVGFMVIGTAKTWEQISSSSINYASAMINDTCDNPKGVFKGIYTVSDMPDGEIKIYSFFSGLGIPKERIDQLQKETAELQSKAKHKDEQRNLTLSINMGTNETVSQAQKIKEKIQQKNSNFGKFVSGAVSDRRK